MRSVICVLVLATLGAGCVPVTEPVGDIEKAEPDKELIGLWTEVGGKGAVDVTVSAPAIAGNPKGLMRVSGQVVGRDPAWFFVTAVGKHKYANVIMRPGGTRPVQFDKPNLYADWQKETNKAYWVVRCAVGTVLECDGGNAGAMAELMDVAGIPKDVDKLYYKTPREWLAKHLTKHESTVLFDGRGALGPPPKYTRYKLLK